jgi:transcriptional regulator with XRE-family HTH domain
VINRSKLSVLGTYLFMAMQLAGVSISELARRSGLAPSTIAKLMKGQGTVKDKTLARLCDLMGTPAWLEERIMHAAGYASREQRQFVQNEGTIAEAEQRVAQEIAQRKKGGTP